ncbi:chitin deacetylase [Mortierella sp. GBA30]|nr:chitin deacetylase [Mortierella sp. GBA30]
MIFLRKVVKVSPLAVLAVALTAVSAQNTTTYPPPNQVPDVSSAEVQAWLKEINLTGAPSIAPYPAVAGSAPVCPAAASNANDCIWTCQNCTNGDLTDCSAPNTWGLTFDDGPSTFTPSLLDYLQKNKHSATFFLIGSNVVAFPDTVKRQVAEGHHLASHTWSHAALTTLTNEQIVAEMKWTEKAVFDITGLKLKYMRPPYGEINNRVRFVLNKMGYIPVDWTGDAFDTRDWDPSRTSAQKVTGFTQSLDAYAATTRSKGFYCLEHDITAEEVSLAQQFIPLGVARNISFASVAGCEKNAAPYQNSITTATSTVSGGPSRSTAVPGGSATVTVTGKGSSAASHVGGKAVAIASTFAALIISIVLV